MRKLLLTVICFSLPFTTFAKCIENNYTVIYTNGILTSYDEAFNDLQKLGEKFEAKSEISNVKFINGYNPSHLAGAGDWIDSVRQIYTNNGSYINEFDLRTILEEIYPELTTRKVLIVGHSQGTFYANEIYNYFLSHGVPREDVAVYNIATPASYVSGNGKYLTSVNDKLIQRIRSLAKEFRAPAPLLPNILLPISAEEETDPYGGHSLSNDYLAHASDRIVKDIQNELNKLEATGATETGDCFTPPSKQLSDDIESIILSGLDPASNFGLLAMRGTYDELARAISNDIRVAQLAMTAVGWMGNTVRGALTSLTERLSAELKFLSDFRMFGGTLSASPALTSPALEEGKDAPAAPVGAAIHVPDPSPVFNENSDLASNSESVVETAGPNAPTEPLPPLIPPPPVLALVSPGFGGGAPETQPESSPASSGSFSEEADSVSVPNFDEATSTATSTPSEASDEATSTVTTTSDVPSVSEPPVVEAGWYCSPDTDVILPDATFYDPQSGECTYLSGFIPEGETRTLAFYYGSIGSGILISEHSTTHQLFTAIDDDIPEFAVGEGDPMFVAMWKPRAESNDDADFLSYLSSGVGAPPTGYYEFLPFTFGTGFHPVAN